MGNADLFPSDEPFWLVVDVTEPHAVSSLKRSYKAITVAEDGTVLSMKSRPRAEVAE